MWSALGFIAVLALGLLLARRIAAKQAQKRVQYEKLFASVLDMFENPALEPQGPNELPKLKGTYKGHRVQIRPVIDTLATRRLPALWLLVTLHDRLPVDAKFDLMMRPAGPTTFSNFDSLPDAVSLPRGFPDYAVVRSDNAAKLFPVELVKPHLGLFNGPNAKELLITETGIRIVWLMAEADRARYGVFRQADFGEVTVERQPLQNMLENILAIRENILNWHKDRT